MRRTPVMVEGSVGTVALCFSPTLVCRWLPPHKSRPRPRRGLLCDCASKSETDGHRLGGQVVVENRLAHLAPPAGLLIAAKRQCGIEDVVAVDPHCAGFEACRQSVRFADVAGPDSGRQTIDRVVGLVDQGIPRFRKRCHCQDRKSTRLNSSHSQISYAVFCLKKKK